MSLVKERCKYHVQYKILLQLQNFLVNAECLPLLWRDTCCRLIYPILSLPRNRLTGIAVVRAHLPCVQGRASHHLVCVWRGLLGASSFWDGSVGDRALRLLTGARTVWGRMAGWLWQMSSYRSEWVFLILYSYMDKRTLVKDASHVPDWEGL